MFMEFKRRPHGRGALLATCLLLVAALLAACGDSESSDSGGGGAETAVASTAPAGDGARCEQTDEWSVAFQPQLGLAPVDLAARQGFLAEECIEQSYNVVAQPTIGLANLASGRDQLFTGPISVLYQATQQGIDLRVIGPAAYNGPGVAVVSARDIDGYGDLGGKTIAVAGVNTTIQSAMAVQMEEAGVDLDTVRFTQLPFPAIGEAIAAGRASAGFLVEPFVTIDRSKFKVLQSGPLSIFGRDAIAAYAYIPGKLYEEDRALVERYQRAYLKGAAYAARDPQAVRDFAVEVLRTPRPVADRMGLLGFGTDFQIESAMKELEAMQRLGYLEPGVELEDLRSKFLLPQS